MKNKKLRNALNAIIFVLIFVLSFSYLTKVFVPKWLDSNAEASVGTHFYEQKKDSLEVVFLGSSQITQCVDTVELYKKYGILSYDLGGSHNTLLVNYYWLLDVFKTQKNIKTVVVDTSLVFNRDTEQDVNYRKNLDYMKWSMNKFNAIKDYHDKIPTPLTESDSLFKMETSFMFPLTRFHSRWNELDEKDFNMEKYDVYNIQGYTAACNRWRPTFPYERFCIENDERDDDYKLFNEVQTSYLHKIIDECKSRGVECILIKTPKSAWNKTAHNYVEKLAKERDVPFLEYTTDKALKEMNFVWEQDMRDGDHLNARGSVKFSDLLGKYLVEHGEYTDYRKKNGISKKLLKKYEKAKNHCYLSTALTPEEFLKELKNDKYSIAIQSSGDISDYWTPELQKQLEELGFSLKIAELKGFNYAAGVKNGEEKVCEVTKDVIDARFRVIPSIKLKLIYEEDQTKTALVHEKAYEYSKEGLRFTVFDSENGFLTTRATFYESDGKLELFVETVE